MTTTQYTDANISPRTNVYAERQMLKHAMPELVLERFAKTVQMPKNKTQVIKWRRPRTFTAADTPLTEGVTPSATQFSYEDVQATLRQYGQVVTVTDHIADTHEDPVLNDASVQCGENIGRTIEALNYSVVKAGTSVYYANGSARSSVNTTISLNDIRKVTRYLRSQKAKKITRILDGSQKYATHPVEAAYIAVAHTDCEADIRGLPGFKTVAEYGNRSPISEYECGTAENVRFILSSDLGPFESAGGTPTGVVSTDGSSADVYPILFFGQEAWATVALRGYGAVSPTIIPVGQKTKDDPLGQRGYVGWKTWHAAAILNETWMSRLEVAVTDL